MKQYLFIFALFLGACGNVGGLNLGHYPDPDASPDKFILCHGYGCSHPSLTNFTKPEWKQVQKIFKKKSKTANAERAKISTAIALMEKFMGDAVGTKEDLAKAPLKRKSKKELDCIDETINTTKYLTFLEQDGLLHFHTVGRPIYKGFILNGVYPHNSATIEEIETGDIYAVDSYIYENGSEPDIRGVNSWLNYRIEDIERAERMTRDAAEKLTQ